MFKINDVGFVVQDGTNLAVAHSGLAAIPFEASIESWVREYFPGANYTQRDVTGIDAPDLRTRGVIAIQAPKGAGKSKAVRAAVAALPEAHTAVQITFRRTLAWSSCEMMGKNATLYSNVVESTISARQHPRLTIVVNSINRVRGSYDVVVIDEIVSVLDMLAGSLLSASSRVAAACTLAYLIASARVVVVADAMLDAACLDFVLLCRRLQAGGVPAATAAGDPGCAELRVIDYVRRIHTDYRYIAHAHLDTWTKELSRALAAGKRCVVPCMTKAQALRLFSQFSHLYDTQCYTADVDPTELNTHMSNIHEHWTKVQLLIYSPVITAGCSYELPHFDAVFFYGYVALGSVRSAIQMIARVRDVKERVVHVFIAGAKHYDPLPGALSPLHILSTDAAQPQDTQMRILRLLDTYRKTEDLHAAQAFPYYFWALVVHSGAHIHFPGEELLAGVPPELLGAKMKTTTTAAAAAAGVSPALHQSAPAAAKRELWFLHDWTAQASGLDDYPLVDAVGLPAGATLLQKAQWARYEHLLDHGLLSDPLGQELKVLSKCTVAAGNDLPDWCVTQETERRLRSWAALVVQKSVQLVGAGPPTNVAVTTAVPMALLPDAPSQILVFPPAAMGVGNKFTSKEVRDECVAHVLTYMKPTHTMPVMDTCESAWILAGMEQEMRDGVPVSKAALQRLPGPGRAYAMKLAERMSLLFLRMRLVAVNVPVGTKPGAMGVLDFVCIDRAGDTHLILCRTSGCLATTGHADIVKSHVLASVFDRRVASIRVVYVLLDQQVLIDTREWRHADLRDSLTTFNCLRPWQPELHVVFGCPVPATATATGSSDDAAAGAGDGATAADGDGADAAAGDGAAGPVWALLDPVTGATCVAATTDEVVAFLGPRRRLVTWSTPTQNVDPQLENRVFDMHAAVALHIGCSKDVRLPIEQARVMTPPTPTPSPTPPSDAKEDEDDADDADDYKETHSKQLNVVRELYKGVMSKGLLVYFWNSRPWGLPLQTIPSTRFIQQLTNVPVAPVPKKRRRVI